MKDYEFIAEIYRRAGILANKRKRRKAAVLVSVCCIGVFGLSVLAFQLGKNTLPQMSTLKDCCNCCNNC